MNAFNIRPNLPQAYHVWRFISRLLRNIRGHSTLPSLQYITFVYTETYFIDPDSDKANINLDPNWIDMGVLERILLDLPKLEYVASKPWPDGGGCGFGVQDRAIFDACFPTIAQRGMLRYLTNDYQYTHELANVMRFETCFCTLLCK